MIDFSKAVIGGDEKAVKSTKIVGKKNNICHDSIFAYHG